MPNTGRAFEALTQEVFSRLVAQSRICSKVERDVVLHGKSTQHQIDVTFEFRVGPTAYRTIIQCKDWASAVKQEQVLAFHAVLSDIPGQPRGIIVSRSGFQEGAKRVAAHHGIQLYELRPPVDEDWDGLIRAVHILMKLSIPEFENVRFRPDEAWIRGELLRAGAPMMEVHMVVRPGLDPLVFESGAKCDLKAILNQYVPSGPCERLPVRHAFAEPLLLPVPGGPIPRIRVSTVEADVTVREHEELLEFRLDHLIAYCFRDVLTGGVRFLGTHGEPMEASDGVDG